ncbi:SPTBN5 [Cordylochernes scorpioides]|uniref:SPTBN5 n=1 Tax=Cordylochernes scorpioides TaxID=51811 RepID=A0ABY6JX39_9ARAC|nr:SPTBN5 [Cordylochernes scorpioides]
MQEKLDKICVDEIGRDLQTVQALQRKHENVVRELAPVEDKFNRVNLLADSVKASYPSEKETVAARQRELQSLWNQVKAKTAERRTRLDESRGLQIFKNSAKALVG